MRAKYLRWWCLLRLVLAGLALADAIAFAIHFKDAHMVGQPIQQRTGQSFRSEGFGPFVEWLFLVINIAPRSER